MFEGVADLRWMDSAACARLEDPSVMFPVGAVDPAALHACATCPVKALCREHVDQVEHGLTTRSLIAGFVAGETVEQRITRRKAARAGRLRLVASRRRCPKHPAYEPDYCPSCGTAQVIGR